MGTDTVGIVSALQNNQISALQGCNSMASHSKPTEVSKLL